MHCLQILQHKQVEIFPFLYAAKERKQWLSTVGFDGLDWTFQEIVLILCSQRGLELDMCTTFSDEFTEKTWVMLIWIYKKLVEHCMD